MQPAATRFDYSLDLTRLSAAYEAGRLTPLAVVRDVLFAIEAGRSTNPAWIHVVPRDALLDRAAAVEQRRAAGERLQLYGVPFAVKDNIDLADQPTSAACPAFSYVPAESAHAVQRLEQAGAICIGKTNMDQFATGLVGTRSPFGACVNPFDARYIAGGSSSGSAVAVALGHVSFALGTDTAGSGRVPAGFCNIVGLKPSKGLVGMSGVVPACRSLDCISIFALTAGDAATVLELMKGHDASDPYSAGVPPFDFGPAYAQDTPAAKTRPFSGSVRYGVPRAADLRFFGDSAAEHAFGRSIEMLRSLGAELVEIDYCPFAETARLLYDGPWLAERLAAIKPFFESSSDKMDPVVRGIIAGGAGFTAVDAFEAQYRLQALKGRCAEEWQRMDMLVVPTTGTIYRLDEIAAEPIVLNANLGYYTNFVNLLDLAAIAVPSGFREDGLPCGITMIAPALQDAALAQWGVRFQRAARMTLGATAFELPDSEAVFALADEGITLAVVGAHLSGMPLNHQLTSRGATLIEASATAPSYRLYVLPGTTPPRPGLARLLNGHGAAIEVELWSIPPAAFGAFVAEVPPPLAIGTVTLADGRQVKGFVCEGYAVEGARDISSYGGWRNYVEGTG